MTDTTIVKANKKNFFAFISKQQLGSLVTILLILDGSFFLAAFLLRTRIYGDGNIYLMIIAALINIAVIVGWFLKLPRSLLLSEPHAHSEHPHHGRELSQAEKKKRRKKH